MLVDFMYFQAGWHLEKKMILNLQEIELSEILQIESHQNGQLLTVTADRKTSEDADCHGHVFEVHCSNGTIYYVGEGPEVGVSSGSVSRGMVRSVQSGSGLELAKSWETAIRQARLPLTLGEAATVDTVSVSVEVDVEDLKLESMYRLFYVYLSNLCLHLVVNYMMIIDTHFVDYTEFIL